MSITDPNIRRRELVAVPKGTGSSLLTVTSGGTSAISYPYQQIGEEITISRRGSNWLNFQRLKRKAQKMGYSLPSEEKLSRMDMGTNFTTTKKWVETNRLPMVSTSATSSVGSYTYTGPWVAKDHNVGPTSSLFPAYSDTDLVFAMISKGATAIARVAPTNPVAGAAQFLGELREGLPSVPGKHLIGRPKPSSLGDEYLNGVFGVLPLVGDLRKFGEAARTADKVVAQLKRDSGRLIRRRYTFPIERTVTGPTVQNTNWYGSPGLRTGSPNPYATGGGKLTFTREETREYWFSGAFTYLYIDGDSAVERMSAAAQRLNRLYGIRPTVETLWELTPWSWAADWFANVGDVAHNIAAFSNDSLVMRWGYVMCTYTIRDTYLAEGVSLKGNPSGPLTQTFVTQVKKRVRATPYGFGLDPAVAFSPRQWAILSALGLSRGGSLL